MKREMADDRNYTYGYKSIPQAKRTLTHHQNEQQEPKLSNRRSKLGLRTYKILLIGETNAGKTALAIRLVEDRFSVEHTVHTVGFDMCEKDILVGNDPLKIQIWDTAGSESYDSITTQYYRGGAGIIVVYDITCRRSFTQLSKWMNYIETHATADVCVMLLGCKKDLEDYREVETADAKKYADNFNIVNFHEVSAKTGENVSESFEAFFKQVHQKVIEETRPKPEPILEEPRKSRCCGNG